MEITWDEPKRLANLAKHGLDFASVTASIFDADLVQDAKHGRFKVIGLVDGVAVAMIFPQLGQDGISIISLRRAIAKEGTLL